MKDLKEIEKPKMNKLRDMLTAITTWIEKPIGVAVCSNLFFAIMVIIFGSWIQQNNWKEQEKISRINKVQDSFFEKRISSIDKLSYLYLKWNQLIWQIRNNREHLFKVTTEEERIESTNRLIKLGEEERDLLAQWRATVSLMIIYFDSEGEHILHDAMAIKDKLVSIVYNFYAKTLSEAELRKQLEEAILTSKLDETNAMMENLFRKLVRSLTSKVTYAKYLP